jgi:hypothetical protein
VQRYRTDDAEAASLTRMSLVDAEGLGGGFVALVNVEHIHDLHQVHGVENELPWIHKFDLSALALQARMQPDQFADPARVHHGDVGQVQDEVRLTLLDRRNHGITKAVDRIAQAQGAFETNDLHPTLFSCADIHCKVLIARAEARRYTPQTLRENLAGCNSFSFSQEL